MVRKIQEEKKKGVIKKNDFQPFEVFKEYFLFRYTTRGISFYFLFFFPLPFLQNSLLLR